MDNLYYTPPSDKIFNEVKEKCLEMGKQTKDWEKEFRKRFTKKITVSPVGRKSYSYYKLKSSDKTLKEIIEFIDNLLEDQDNA